MNKQQAARDIIAQLLPLVPFEGWTQVTLGKAALAAGYKKTDAIRVFPGGAIESVDFYIRECDAAMVEALKAYSLDTMKIRERIALCVRLRILTYAPHREAARKAIAMQSLPFYAHRSLQALYDTVDTIWHAIGDTSTDFNFYTKRLTLAAVYSSTLLTWLDDKSPDYNDSWDFLDRRIENVMQFERAKHKLKNALSF